MESKAIIDAYCRIRTIDNTIPDDVLDYMKEASLSHSTLIAEHNMMKEALGRIKVACFRSEKGVDKDWLMNQINETLKKLGR